jgi:hypothetical protein
MSLKWPLISLALIFILPLGVTFVSMDAATAPNSVELVCQLGIIITPLQDHHINNDIVLPVYMTNVKDSVFGFELVINSAYPELVRFAVASQQGDVINAKFDTAGTRCRGFKYLQARIQDSLHGQVKIVGVCDDGSLPLFKPIPPGSGILINLIMETTDGDSVCASMPVLTVSLQLDRSQTNFMNPAAQIIGCNYVPQIDTVYGCCKTWNSESTDCQEYWPPEHMCITDHPQCVSIDTLRRVLIDGSNEFTCGPCGGADGDSDGDGICDSADNCTSIYNPGQEDYDHDGIGDACDSCDNFKPVVSISAADTLIRFHTSYGYYPNISDADGGPFTISYLQYPHWCSVGNDSVVGLAPDTSFRELMKVEITDSCNLDTVAFHVSVYLCGNADGEGKVNIADAVYLIAYIFSHGSAPSPLAAGDADCDGVINIADAVYLIEYIFSHGAAPCAACK